MQERIDRPWFGKRSLGIGFRPKTIEGWIVVILFIIALIIAGSQYNFDLSGNALYGFLSLSLPLLLLFLLIAFIKREK